MALGVIVFPLILIFAILVVCVAIAYFFVSEKSRVGCLVASGGLLLVFTVTVAMFYISWNTN